MALLHVHEAPPALSLLRADISPFTDSVIQKALAKRPEQRFQTAGEFSAAFTLAIQISGKVYQIDPDGKPLLDQHLQGVSSGAQRALLTAKPVVRIKPASHRTFDLPRLLIAIILLLSVTVGAAIAGGSITSHLVNNAPAVHVQLTVPANIAGDDLANIEDWPTGGTFFFSGEQYHIQNKLPHNVALAFYADHQYTNFHLTVTVSEIHGTGDGGDYYGVAFRGSADQSHYYLFEVVAWGGGQYQFLRYDGGFPQLQATLFRRAQENDPAATYVLGYLETNPLSDEPSHARAFGFYHRAAALGHHAPLYRQAQIKIVQGFLSKELTSPAQRSILRLAEK